MRWNRLWGALALALAVTAGCKQRCFMTESDFNRTTTTLLEHMELNRDLGAQPITEPTSAPPTLNNLDRKIRYISLAECIAIALETGRVGQPNLLFPGTANDNLVQFNGRGVSGSDAIRAFALEPARAGAEIEAALSKFDAAFTAGMNWTNTDQPIGTPLQTFQAGASNVNSIRTEEAQASVGLLKPLATGGVAGITFNVPYQYTNLPARVNPSYRPQLQFQFEQPLLQGFGVEINQLRAQHPGSVLAPGVLNGAPTAEGILISRLRFDQSRAEFERQLNQMLLNVEVGYWNLYGRYWQLYSREQGLRFAFEAFKLNKAKYEAGRATAADFYQSRGQYELFRAQRLEALDQVLESERQLRALVGIDIEDGTRLMPSDSPTLAPFQPDWNSAENEALTKRPEIFMVRQEIKASQMRLLLAKNSLLPDLRLTATYDANSIGNRLDGAATPFVTRDEFTDTVTGARDSNALRALADNNYNNWAVGLRMVVPLGFRLGYTQVRQAQVELARNIEILKDQELKVKSYLANYYRRLSINYETIRAQRAQRESFGEQLRARQQEYLAGRGTLDTLLEAQRFWADALNSEYQSIVAYNNALAGFEFAKGSIQGHNNIHIAEGPLPASASIRAAEAARQRTAALVLRERAAPSAVTPAATRMETADGRAPTLPSVMAATPPLREAPALPATMEALKSSEVPAPVEARMDDLFPAQPGTTTVAPVTRTSATTPMPTPTPAAKAPTPTPAPTPAPAATTPTSALTPSALPPLRKPPVRRPSEFGTVRSNEE
jgi:outer membrane protein TolC